jgi:hypothetical protein
MECRGASAILRAMRLPGANVLRTHLINTGGRVSARFNVTTSVDFRPFLGIDAEAA